MAKPTSTLTLFLMSFCVLGLLIKSTSTRSQDSATKTPPKPQIDKSKRTVDITQFPVTDYFAAKPSDPKERAKRDAKGKKYNDRYAPRITELTDRISSYSEWDRGLTPLPVPISSAVIIGEVTRAEAHLSEDESAIYSEFEVRVETIFKTSPSLTLRPGNLVNVERTGGRVRFPSGKIVVSSIENQDMPKVGRRYALFLIQEFPMIGRSEDFNILTGYELSDGHVFQLDKVGSQSRVYHGSDESEFLRDLRSAANNASSGIPIN